MRNRRYKKKQKIQHETEDTKRNRRYKGNRKYR